MLKSKTGTKTAIIVFGSLTLIQWILVNYDLHVLSAKEPRELGLYTSLIVVVVLNGLMAVARQSASIGLALLTVTCAFIMVFWGSWLLHESLASNETSQYGGGAAAAVVVFFPTALVAVILQGYIYDRFYNFKE